MQITLHEDAAVYCQGSDGLVKLYAGFIISLVVLREESANVAALPQRESQRDSFYKGFSLLSVGRKSSRGSAGGWEVEKKEAEEGKGNPAHLCFWFGVT